MSSQEGTQCSEAAGIAKSQLPLTRHKGPALQEVALLKPWSMLHRYGQARRRGRMISAKVDFLQLLVVKASVGRLAVGEASFTWQCASSQWCLCTWRACWQAAASLAAATRPLTEVLGSVHWSLLSCQGALVHPLTLQRRLQTCSGFWFIAPSPCQQLSFLQGSAESLCNPAGNLSGLGR